MGDSPGEESTEDTDADRRPFRRWRASCMKDTKLMRKNVRFRWSWEHGGDLISLTFRVAAVVNGVIGVIIAGLKGGGAGAGFWDKKPIVGGQDQTPLGTIGTTAWSPILANRGLGRGPAPVLRQIGGGDGGRPPAPGKSGAGPHGVPAPGPIGPGGRGRGRGSGVPRPAFKDQTSPKRQTALPPVGDHRSWTPLLAPTATVHAGVGPPGGPVRTPGAPFVEAPSWARDSDLDPA